MKTACIAFYNTENFFDFTDDPKKFENEFTPKGSKKWTLQRYLNKLNKISGVISELGFKETGEPPILVGLAEIENKKVLQDLVNSAHLENWNYDYVHFESLDERGIDVALLYRKDFIEIIHSAAIRTPYVKADGDEDFSRDVLYVELKLESEILHVLTIHLPSRRDDNKNLEFRNLILKSIREKVDEILQKDENAQIVIMGDFNGNPNDVDAQNILKTTSEIELEAEKLYNPMLNFGYGAGTLKHEGKWLLFDQILFSKAFVCSDLAQLNFVSAHIYKDRSVQDWDRKFKGSPFRTFAGTKYLGGYSDHFPIYAIINY